MKRRWIIRGFFMGLLLLCAGGWVVSAMRMFGVARATGLKEIVCASHAGTLVIQYANWGPAGGPAEWRWQWEIPSDVQWWPTSDNFALATPRLGFAFLYRDDGPQSYGEFAVPYWFFMVVFSTMLWLVWRKTRPPATGRAFPVETDRPAE